MICQTCKKEVPNNSGVFCPKCGGFIAPSPFSPLQEETRLAQSYNPEEKDRLNRLCARLAQERLNQSAQDGAKSISQPVKHSSPPVVKVSKPVEKRKTKDGTVDSARNRECPQKRSWFGSLFKKLFQ